MRLALSKSAVQILKIGALAGVTLFTLFFQNCGSGFSSAVSKSSLLAGTNVFASDGLLIPDANGKCFTPTGAEVPCPATPTPSPTPVGYTPTPTPPGYTPTPAPVGYTPTPTPPGLTPTPNPTATPTATPRGQTPTPTPVPTATPRGRTPTPAPTATPTPVIVDPTPTPTPIPVGSVTEMPVDFYCSNGISSGQGTNLSNNLSATYTLQFVKNGNTVCSLNDDSIRDTLINEKKFSIPNLSSRCPSLSDGQYTLYYSATGKNSIAVQVDPSAEGPQWWVSGILVNVSHSNNTISLAGQYYGDCAYNHGPGSPCQTVFDISNPGQIIYSANFNGNDHHTGAFGQCDASASPLIISLTTESQTNLVLTPPLSGIDFDILGANSQPTAYGKKKISWLANGSRATNYFLVLPNASGQVNGIDELFGNNTKGPDQNFAANGYAALAKYDGRKNDGTYIKSAQDSIIDSRDPIFSQLRLWNDTNGDGIAQAEELHTLASLKVEAIDLTFDPSYKEVDKYGNKVLYKSVVKTTDGNLHLIFDIWFRYL